MRAQEVLRAGELVVRRYRIGDAPLLYDALADSVEHLRPWMGWAVDEPAPVADQQRKIERWDVVWESGTDFPFGMFLGDLLVGGCGLHRRIAEDGIEIGYWVRAGYTGRGYATAAAGALTDAAFAMPGITHVEIHHDKANVASRRVPEKLGYELVREVEEEITAPATTGVSCEWQLRR